MRCGKWNWQLDGNWIAKTMELQNGMKLELNSILRINGIAKWNDNEFHKTMELHNGIQMELI